MKTILRTAAMAVLLGGASAAHAVAISGSGSTAFGQSGKGSFSGDLSFSALSSTQATLTIELTNTSNPANTGFITAFVLNNPNDLITNISLVSTDTDFGLLGLSNNNVNGSPFGQFDFGASTGGSFNGGGPPSQGIAVGATETFTFSLTGTGLDTLSANAFLSALSSGTGSGEGFQSFVVRFRGFADGDSDKVPTVDVPAPGALGLLGLGLIAIAARRRRI